MRFVFFTTRVAIGEAADPRRVVACFRTCMNGDVNTSSDGVMTRKSRHTAN